MVDWKQKIAAFLHDPPSKCLDIRTHGERSDAAFRQAGITDETEIGKYFTKADHTAASADRLPFPASRASGMSCAFDGIRNSFKHPLTGETLSFGKEFKSVAEGFEGEQSVQPSLTDKSLAAFDNDEGKWRARMFAHWRLWAKHATEKDFRYSLLPADTRIPDHSIWTHMQVVSGLAGCFDHSGECRPAFLKLQLGPVQDFIAAARSTRDLWSGSYLLSWLMAKGLQTLTAQTGPDAVVFPNLLGQPLFDLHWKNELWDRVSINDENSVWDTLAWGNKDLLTPNLPNLFLAVVPSDEGRRLAEMVEESMRKEWMKIATSVWDSCSKVGLSLKRGETSQETAERRERFFTQIEQFLSVSWSVTDWPDSLDAAIDMAADFSEEMPVSKSAARVEAIRSMAEDSMPKNHRDGRFYFGGKDGPKDKLNNIGLGWSVILAFNQWHLDSVRQTRNFTAKKEGGWSVGVMNNKDSLTGRDEAVAGGAIWKELAGQIDKGPWSSLFKHNDWLGASTLVKRVWHISYLNNWNDALKTDSAAFPMPNTRSIARHLPWAVDDNEDLELQSDEEKYFAVIALDGDEIGKWVSGELTPKFSEQLAAYADGSGNPSGAMEYFERESNPDNAEGNLKERYSDFLESNRALSPSYHLQFSHSLGNFALRCARKIVEAYDGRLIYAGGDDVLAILPSDSAINCARSLRNAFRGEPVFGPDNSKIFDSPAPGFLSDPDVSDDLGNPIPLLLLGAGADCSAGIAIAHFKSPLQDIVKAAQSAEKRAKKASSEGGYGRGAVAVSLYKRSGEIIHWGSKWEEGVGFYSLLVGMLGEGILSSRFPHQLAALLEPYITQKTGLTGRGETAVGPDEFPVDEIIQQEFEHCLSRHRGENFHANSVGGNELVSNLRKGLQSYLMSLNNAEMKSVDQRLRSMIGLCQTIAFAHRTSNHLKP
jgi:CRISPR-associated protein Cmr2